MKKKLLILNIILTLIASPLAFAQEDDDFWNELDPAEFPNASDVMPYENITQNKDGQLVIESGIEKTVDLTLMNCIELALGNNPDINMAFHDSLASDTRIRQVWSNYFPKFSWQTGYTRIKQLQLSDALGRNLTFNYFILGQITLQQMLYDFGVTQNQATIRRLEFENAKQTVASTINNVIYQTKDAYYNLLYANQQKAVALDTVKKFELFYNQAKSFYEIGLNPKVDVTIAEANLSDAKLSLIRAENAVNLAIARLNNVMGVPFMEKSYQITSSSMNLLSTRDNRFVQIFHRHGDRTPLNNYFAGSDLEKEEVETWKALVRISRCIYSRFQTERMSRLCITCTSLRDTKRILLQTRFLASLHIMEFSRCVMSENNSWECKFGLTYRRRYIWTRSSSSLPRTTITRTY